MARLAILRGLNVPTFLQGLADFLLRQVRFFRPVFRYAFRLSVLSDEFGWIHILRLPIQIGDLVFRPQKIFRIAMALQAPLHAHWLRVGDHGHMIDLAMTTGATDPAIYMRSVIVKNVVRETMDPDPLHRLSCFPTRPHRLELWIIFLHLLMTSHASLGVGHIRVRPDFDETVAITAVHSQLGHVNVVWERYGLNRLVTDLGIFRRHVIPGAGGQTAYDHEAANRQFERQPV